MPLPDGYFDVYQGGIFHTYDRHAPFPARSLCGRATTSTNETKTPGAMHCRECLVACDADPSDFRWQWATDATHPKQ